MPALALVTALAACSSSRPAPASTEPIDGKVGAAAPAPSSAASAPSSAASVTAAPSTPPAPAPALVRPPLAGAPLVRHPERAARCGKLSSKLGAELPLLADRLRVTAPKGARETPRPWDIMGAPEPTASETRVMLGGGKTGGRGKDEALVIFAQELWQLDPDLARPEPGAIVQPASFADEAPKFLEARYGPSEIAAVAVADPELHVFAAWPRAAELGDRDSAVVLAMIASMSDGSLVTVSFHISPALIKHASGCTDVAERVAASLLTGPRKLERGGGVKTLRKFAQRDLTIALPPDHVLLEKPGPDFDQYEIFKLRPLSLYPGRLSVVLTQHPDSSPSEGGVEEAGTLLGQAVKWRGERGARGGLLAALLPVPGASRWFVHVLAHATREPKYLDEFRKIAETLTLTP